MEKLSMDQNYISEEILLEEIIPKLPVKSIMRFKCVSKSWLAHISSECTFKIPQKPYDLIRGLHEGEYRMCEHLRLFLVSDGETNLVQIDMSYLKEALKWPEDQCDLYLVGSSNGLVLIQLEKYLEHGLVSPAVLWNPATREFRNIPEPTVPTVVPGMPSRPGVVHYSFGFGKDINDYKIVRIGSFVVGEVLEERTSVLDVQIFTKSSGCWRQVEVKSGGFELQFSFEGGVIINGIIHWTLMYGPGNFRVLTFDLQTEELKEIDGPPPERNNYYWHELNLFNWKGCLGGLLNKHFTENEFWLKTNDGNSNSLRWTKILITRPPESMGLFHGVFRDEFVFHNNSGTLFDPITKRKRSFDKAYGSRVIPCVFHRYIPSLLSPN